MKEIRDVLDDLLDVKYQCSDSERHVIIKDIMTRFDPECSVKYGVAFVDSFWIGGVLVVVEKNNRRYIKSCIHWTIEAVPQTQGRKIPVESVSLP